MCTYHVISKWLSVNTCPDFIHPVHITAQVVHVLQLLIASFPGRFEMAKNRPGNEASLLDAIGNTYEANIQHLHRLQA